MPKERLNVVVTRRLPEAVETRLKELFNVTLRDDDTPMTRRGNERASERRAREKRHSLHIRREENRRFSWRARRRAGTARHRGMLGGFE